MPQIISSGKHGVNRTDAVRCVNIHMPVANFFLKMKGMLGAGIYFGDSVSTAVQYTTPCSKSTRFMLVCDVRLTMPQYIYLTNVAFKNLGRLG